MKKTAKFDLLTLFDGGRIADDFGISLKTVVPCCLDCVTLSDGSLSGSGVLGLQITDSTFSDLWLVKSGFYDSRFQRVVFRNCRIRELDFVRCNFRSVVFEDCDMSEMSIDDSTITDLKFVNCLFASFTFLNTQMEHLRIEKCKVELPLSSVYGAEGIDQESLKSLQAYRFEMKT